MKRMAILLHCAHLTITHLTKQVSASPTKSCPMGYNWFDLKKTLFLNLMDFTTATYINQADKDNTGVTMCTKTICCQEFGRPALALFRH